jgi:hypothetical protein
MAGTGHMDGCAGARKIGLMASATKMVMGTWCIQLAPCTEIVSILNVEKTKKQASDTFALANTHF